MKGKRGGAGSKTHKELRGSGHVVRGKSAAVRETKRGYVKKERSAPQRTETSIVSFGASRKVNPMTVSVTAVEAARIPSRTDFPRVDAKTDEDIARDVAGDPDAAPIFTDEMFDQAQWVEPLKKTPISFRVDPDVLAFFKSEGAGYQSRMNAVLRAYMERSRKR
jgi:uncharacterized protein (DUF4415 family)